MPQTDDFWRPRACLVPPIPELDLAADLVTAAADAFLASNLDLARQRLIKADMPVLLGYARRIMGREDVDIHRRRSVPISTKSICKSKARMPPAKFEGVMYARDGWRCRFCGCRVILKQARNILRASLPDALPWTNAEGFHAAFYALTATVDHVIPHSAGGDNDLANLVTACWPCQFGRGAYSLEEFGLLDPRLRAPIIDKWDGLGRLTEYASPPPQPKASDSEAPAAALKAKAGRVRLPTVPYGQHTRNLPQDQWFATLDCVQTNLSRRWVSFVESCADVGVSWNVNEVMIVRMKANGKTIQQFAVHPNGDVNIPWLIADQKDQFRAFAHRLAEAIPGADARQTPKQWIVDKVGKTPVSVMELLDASMVVRTALEELHAALGRPL